MEYIEYPKALYRDGVYLEVADKDADEAAQAEGYTDWNTDHDRSNGKTDAKAPKARKP